MHAMTPDNVRIVDVDLSPFSLGASWVSLSSPLAPLVIMAWIFLVLLVAVVSLPLGIMLGSVTLIVIVAGLVITMKQRMSASTTGHKSAFVRPEHIGQRPPDFDRTFGEIIDAVDAFRRT